MPAMPAVSAMQTPRQSGILPFQLSKDPDPPSAPNNQEGKGAESQAGSLTQARPGAGALNDGVFAGVIQDRALG